MGQPELNTIYLPDEKSGAAFGEQLIGAVLAHLPADRAFVINLSGPLGAGKTTIARAMLRGAGIVGQIRSPTYTLVECYETPANIQFVHIDLYRINDKADAAGLGLREYDAAQTIWLVEWPERAPVATQVDLLIKLAYERDGRHLEIKGESSPGHAVVSALK